MAHPLFVPLRVVASALIMSAASAAAQARPAAAGTLNLTAALVLQNMEVKPMALFALELTSSSGVSLAMRTGLDGKVSQACPAGTYRVRSTTAALVSGRSYSWDVPIEVAAGRTVTIELTNLNASIDSSASPPVSVAASGSSEGAVYERARSAVVRVMTGLGHGSGFLADTLGGVLLTNDHVLGTAPSVSVMTDSVTRVAAQVLARDPEADIAVLRITPDACAGCPRLRLAATPVAPGDRLLAIGYPLHQDRSLTSGIASSIRDGAVISDVSLNHGNSGGPLLNLAGEVVAVNTFGDFSEQGGPGVSGSIPVAKAGRALAWARDTLAASPAPDSARLPTFPLARYDVATLKSMADQAQIDPYKRLDKLETERFALTVTTPVVAYVRRRLFELEVGKDRRKREEKGGVAASERYSETKEGRDWEEYVGDERMPVISLRVEPKYGETGGSFFKRMLISTNLKAKFTFKGDVRAVEVYRDSAVLAPIIGGHLPVKVFVDNQWVSMKDVADMGYHVFDPAAFAPAGDGTPPRITIVITDLKNPDRVSCKELDPEAVALVWNGFEPILEPGGGFVRADPLKKNPRPDPKDPSRARCATPTTATPLGKP